MSAVQPVEGNSGDGQKGGSKGDQRALTLTFQAGDQNGNAFADSSSSSPSPSPSSSSLSPSCRGESSPDSVRSSSSLSSGRSDSPLDVDMQECLQRQGPQLLTVSDGHTESTKETSVLTPDGALQQQHCDCSESNDNSVSVYLDARDNDDDTTWNNNENLALVFIQEDTCGDHGEIHGNQYENESRRRYSDDSPAPLCSSENDDIDDDDEDEDDDQEDSFLSVSSGDVVMRSNSISLNGSERAYSSISGLADSSTTSTSSSSSSDQEPLPPPSPSPVSADEIQDQRSASLSAPVCPEGPALAEDKCPVKADDECPGLVVNEGKVQAKDEVSALRKEPQQEPGNVAGEVCAVGVLEEERQQVDGETLDWPDKLNSAPVMDDVTLEVSTGQENDPSVVQPSTPVGDVASTPAALQEPPTAANGGKQTCSSTKPMPLKTTKPGKNDVKTFPMPDLRNVKSKIMSRPPSSAMRVARTDVQTRGKNGASSSPASNEKKPPAASPRPAQGKQDGPGGGGGGSDARRRSSSCQARVAAPRPAVARSTDPNTRVVPPSRPRRRTTLTNSIQQSSEVTSCGGPEEVGRVGEPLPEGEGQMEKRPEGAGKMAASELTDDSESTTDTAVHEQLAEPQGDNDQTVSSKLGPKSGLPTAVASVTAATAAAAAAAATAGSSAATSASGPLPAPASLAAGATPGTSATSRAKAVGVGPATSSRDARTAAGNVSPPRGRQIQAPGIPKMRVPERSIAASQPTPPVASKTSHNAPGPGITRLPSSSKLPIKGLPTSLSSSSLGSATSENNPAAPARGPNSAPGAKVTSPDEKPSRPVPSMGPQVPNKPLTTKPVAMRNRTTSIPGKTGLKTPALAKPVQSPLQRSASTRLNRASAATIVDKNKPKPTPPAPAPGPVSSPASPPAPAASAWAAGTPTSGQPAPPVPAEKPLGIAHYRQQCERKSQCIQQLRKLLLSGNRRLEALALVVQHVFAEREEALKQKRDLAGELSTIKQELVGSVSSCERLQKEKEEARLTFEETLQKLQEEHQTELTQLEERLRAFYSAEWDKTHQAYQEEANKCRALMQQQVEDVRSKQEALRQEQEVNHVQQMEALKQQYETTLQELQKTHEQNMNALDKTLKDSEASLSRQIEELAMENNELKTQLQAEEERRRLLSEKRLKDAHTLYLEQELESLKVVLEIKTQQLHQQDKKLMQMDKLVETNVKLEECLTKVQQENEDYKARMDKHAALSKQLSTEQAALQQTLQKESKVNKRLSMENEELLWKLHNCDLSSPRRLSPTSPFHSPRNSAAFPTAPLSPR